MKTMAVPFYVAAGDAPGKAKILVAALRLFVRDGVCETSIRDIAKASGFTNPALFKHFESKDALAEFLFERCYLELFHLVNRAIKVGPGFVVRQRAVLEAVVGLLDRDADTVLYVTDQLRHFWPKMPAEVQKHTIIGEVRKMLEDGRREGVVTKKVEIALLTSAWLGTVQQFARERYFDREGGVFRRPAKEVVAGLDELLMRMVKA
jgi:AcrR family transcriptional regulator